VNARPTNGRGQSYRCVSCRGELLNASDTDLQCSQCGRRFPVVNDIPILTHWPRALLVTAHLALAQAQAQIARSRALPVSGGAAFLDRVQRTREAGAANVGLISRYMGPVGHYLRSHPGPALSAFDWIAGHAGGWTPQAMLPFFFQDWGNTSEFSAACTLIVDALVRHRRSAGTVAVLGAGACGIAHAAAAHFETTVAIDLSIPTLLIARGVLAGDSFVVHMGAGRWYAAPVTGPTAPNGRIRLAVADATALPFADQSLSAVVTQYLMDVVGNPSAVIDEIARVLEPGGVWVNFSPPISVPDQPSTFGKPTLDELPDLVEPFGFDVRASDRRLFTPLDLSSLDADAPGSAHEVNFFAASRRAAASARRHPMDAEGDEWWAAVPVTPPGREVWLIRRSTIGGRARQEVVELGVGRMTAAVPHAVVQLVEAVVGPIDGVRTAREVFAAVAERGELTDSEEFREILRFFYRHHGVVDMVASRL
jgi:SAM-dependent methyltransferase